MLSRALSDSGTRLRRSKSTSSVHRHAPPAPEPFDPEVAQQHALAAATAAFARARGSNAAGRRKSRGSDLSRAQSDASRKSLASQGSHFPPRESSLRSVHPRKGGAITNAQRQPRAPVTNTEKFPPFQTTPDTDRFLSTQPSIAFSENTRPRSQPKPLRHNVSSSAASQQIRKARSMYYASSVQTGSPIARPPAKYLTTPPPTSTPPVPEPTPAPKPTQTNTTSSLAHARLPVTIAIDESVDKARDKYLQSFEHPQVKHKPSLFLAPFKKRQDRSKRKEFRASSSISVSSGSQPVRNEVTVDNVLNDFRPSKEKKEKRSFSGSLKSRLKKVFRRASNNSAALPIQQVEASRDYFGDRAPPISPPPPPKMDRGFEIPSPDEATLQRIRARSPSLERPPLLRPGSRGSTRSTRSNRSLHSETNISLPSTSRVTSWADSFVGGTLTQREIKRLTVIHEAKDSIGSEADNRIAPASPTIKPSPIPGFAAFHKPMHMESLVEEGSVHIDPKRVFSALIKEIDASKAEQPQPDLCNRSPGGESDIFVSSANKDLPSIADKDIYSDMSNDHRPPLHRQPVTMTDLPKASSLKSFGKAPKCTIRTVTPTRQASSPIPDCMTSIRGPTQIQQSVTAASSPAASSGSQDSVYRTASPIEYESKAGGTLQRTCASQNTSFISTAEQIQKRKEITPELLRGRLESNEVPVFSRSTNRSLNVTHFIQQISSIEHPRKTASNVVYQSTNQQLFPPTGERQQLQRVSNSPVSPKSPNRRPAFSPTSPSVYSRNTDGASILPNDSNMSLNRSGEDDVSREGESVVILPSQAVKRHVIGTPSPQRCTSSMRSSRDWKAWLSHEISELELHHHERIAIDEQYTPSSQHCREVMQTEDDDTTFTIRQSIEVPTPRHETFSEASQVETPRNQTLSTPLEEPPNISPGPLVILKASSDVPKDYRVSPTLIPSLLVKNNRISCTESQRSSLSQPRADTPRSERMNERFPFIEASRRPKNSNRRSSRQSQSPTDSGSSSLYSKGGTPTSKVYSDFSKPSLNQTSKHESRRLKRIKPTEIDNGNNNTTTSSTFDKRPVARSHISTQSLPVGQPKSTQALNPSSSNQTSSNLAQYTTSIEDITHIKNVPNPADSRQHQLRMRTQMRPVSPVKLTIRPKSAVDLRSMNKPTLAHSSSNISIRANHRLERKENDPIGQTVCLSAPAIGDYPLRMTLDTPGDSTDSCPLPLSPELGISENHRPQLHVKQSSSTLALNKEPSPGTEARVIDSVIETDEEVPSTVIRGGSRGGRATPGQRMAERFLKERTTGNGTGSPTSSIHVGVRREDTPAFI